MRKTFQIRISGRVQGVGFRPFVYKLANRFNFKGFVRNDGDGVCIHITSEEAIAKEFLTAIVQEAPTVSCILSYSIAETSFQEYSDFRILSTSVEKQINVPLTPDFAICGHCKTEIRDKNNRRYGYAFTTCTNCGPRYSITTKFPFERVNTTISEFSICGTCQSEYTDQEDRRFHSQTNSCSDCGISLKLTDSCRKTISTDSSEALIKTAELILKGNIVAIKNANGYLLCCIANDKYVVEKLRQRKQRPAKPFALLYPALEQVKEDFDINVEEEEALTSSVAPIVILNPKNPSSDLPYESIAPKLHQLGVMLPSSALLVLLMDKIKVPIIATSGNIHGSPIIAKESEAIQKLAGVADYFLHHDLEISFPQDDSVLRFAGTQQILLRRSRGLAPNYLKRIEVGDTKILAMGAHLKSTFTFVPNKHCYISQYFGNLDSYDVLQRYQSTIRQYFEVFDCTPEVVLVDSHPQYQSGVLGKSEEIKANANLVKIQHHKAHFCSVLGEHELFTSKEKILGVVWDGTGYGEDGAIWGGEFFTYQNRQIQRLTHFEYFDWIAADKMAKEPRLSLLSVLPDGHRDSIKNKFSDVEWKVYTRMLKNNSLKTSSVGRLFDAVAAMLDIIDKTSYEGEAAMLLESRARQFNGDDVINFLEKTETAIVPTRQLILNIKKAMEEGISVSKIANSFIHTLANVILKSAARNHCGIVACSGGVFQNAILVEKLVNMAGRENVKLKFNRILSSNDENISFGQFCFYKHIKN